jgi:site-specific DNA-cytosine methylase
LLPISDENRSVDVFCGAGGLTIGLLEAGVRFSLALM